MRRVWRFSCRITTGWRMKRPAGGVACLGPRDRRPCLPTGAGRDRARFATGSGATEAERVLASMVSMPSATTTQCSPMRRPSMSSATRSIASSHSRTPGLELRSGLHDQSATHRTLAGAADANLGADRLQTAAVPSRRDPEKHLLDDDDSPDLARVIRRRSIISAARSGPMPKTSPRLGQSSLLNAVSP